MDRFGRRIDRAIWIGLGGVGLGLAVLLTYAWVEYLNNPGISIVDGYWIGRTPWTPIGICLVLGGASLALVSGAVAVAMRGDWLRRLLALPPLLASTCWWLTAVGVIPMPRFQPPDPVTLAYSLPQAAVLMLILPAVAVAALAFIRVPPDRRVRLRRIHSDPPPGHPISEQ